MTASDSYSYAGIAPDKSYRNLFVKAFNIPGNWSGGSSAYYEKIREIQRVPFGFSFPGYYNSSLNDEGIDGRYWSRRAFSSGVFDYATAYLSIATSGEFEPQARGEIRSYGFSVRCVFDPAVGEMQSFTSSMCSSLSTTTATADNRIVLNDSRDGKSYYVAKLADGNCWMVQNLALDGTAPTGSSATSARILSTSDSDVTTSRTLAANITDGTTSDATSVQIYSGIALNNTTSCSYTSCETSSEPYGNLYDWYAATATTGTRSMSSGDATDSVCPKGWKLPTSGTSSAYGSSAPDKSYGKLMYSVLGFTSENATISTGRAYVQKVQQAPLWFPLAGYYRSGLSYQGRRGGYWSRKAYSSSDAYYLSFNANNGDFYPQNYDSKSSGRSVRCVFSPSSGHCNTCAITD